MINILSKASLLGCRVMDIPIEINAKLLSDQGEDMDNPGRYQRLVGKLNYLMVTSLILYLQLS